MVIRDLTQFHENPAAIAWWRHFMGRLLIWLTPPSRRRAMLAAAAVLVGIEATLKTVGKNEWAQIHGHGAVLVVIAQFALLGLVYLAAVRFARLPGVVRRHPQLTLHLSYWVLLVVLLCTTPAAGSWRSVLLGLAILYPLLLWRLGFLLLAGQHGRMAGTGVTDHLIYLWPAWGGYNNTPYGKGLAYLSQYEAKTTDELARSQLAGIKLLLLAVLWALVYIVYEGFVYGTGNALTRAIGGHTVGVPNLSALVALGGQAPGVQSWISIYCELFSQVLRVAVKGHIIVGFLRLYGFNVFRNTYKPLLAESIVEFWNRYYYYFKELLVTFFFLPTFTGLGKRLRKWPNLRLLVAVFAAAFVGNMYYHVIKDGGGASLAQGLVLEVLDAYRSRIFYCLLLAAGIFVSMLREQNRRGLTPATGRAPRIVRIFGVWTFFGLIAIWDVRGGAPFLTRIDFFRGLFGLS